MTRMGRVLAAGAVVLGFAVAGMGQKESDVYRGLKYDKKTETTMVGGADEVRNFDCPVSAAMGNHVVLKTGAGALIVVHTAPVKFMQDYGLVLEKGDQLEVLGSKLKDSTGRDTVIAREVVKKNVRFIFRDSNGKPLW